MRDYFIRRFLLIIPTLLGATLIVFFITRILPGGPVERAIAEAHMASGKLGASSSGGARSGTALSESQIDQLKEYYGFDKPWPVAYLLWLGKVLSGDLGTSYRYNEPVWDRMVERFPVSIYYGLVTAFLTYMISIPLGVLKALKHRTFIDNSSSVLIFVGYAVPGYVLGVMLLLIFGARLEWFPMSGFVSDGFAALSLWGKIKDLVLHSVLPLVCYMIGSFAMTTMMMKNHLMDNLASDYVRTAVAKGADSRRAVLGHAFRNSFIPIATSLGHLISVFVAGSFLIEVVFDIDGFGLLGYTSLLDRDYPVVMGVLLLSAALMLVGNILSDIIVAFVDPRVSFK